LFVVPATEGVGVRSFEVGETYFVISYHPIYVFSAKDVSENGQPIAPIGMIGVEFGCTGGPEPVEETPQWLKILKLGRGEPPLP
jgi:hypothetical protein